MHGQWSNPAYGVIHGVPQVIFTGGDGWLHSFALRHRRLNLWKFDANPKDSSTNSAARVRNLYFIATPVVYKDKIYIGTGQDPEHFDGIGHFWCIDPGTKTGDALRLTWSPMHPKTRRRPSRTRTRPLSQLALWRKQPRPGNTFAKRDYVFGRTMSSACIIDDICYISELAGYLHVLDANTGKKYWQFDLKSAIWGSAYFVDGKVFIGNEDGDLFVFRHTPKPEELDEVEIASKQPDEKAGGKKLIEVRKEVDKKYKIAKIEMGGPIRSTPIVANGVLYIMTENSLIAIGKK